jgi:transcriptional regulator with XRE-family HTH domain
MAGSDVSLDRREPTVGIRLRALRRDRGLSGREVAERAGVSATYLSRVENGRASPTVATLTRVVQAMGASVRELFQDSADGPLVRRADRRVVRNRGADDYLITSSSATRLEVLETVVAPGGGSGEEPYTHPGDEECVLVLEGSLRMWIDESVYDLRAGDAVTFPCRVPHRWRNPGRKQAKALWIITPAGY